jgi:hypothetical protein
VITNVPRPRPPHLHRETTRHGRTAWYVRVDRGKRVRLRGEYGSPEFQAAYNAAIDGKPASDAAAFKAQSLGWLIERYRESSAWTNLSQATRRCRERILLAITKTAGKTAVSRIDRDAVERGIERRNQYGARHFLQTMRGLFQWAYRAKLTDIDPTKELKVTLHLRMVITFGRKMNALHLKRIRRAALANVLPSTSCCTPASVVATRSGLVDPTSRMA